MESVIEGLTAWELEHLAAINTYEKKVEAPESEASGLRWLQAEEVDAALDAGVTERKVADNWKRDDGTTYSKSHVHYVQKTWAIFGHLGDQDRPPFNEAYHSDKVRKPDAHVSQNTGENEWYTPAPFIDAAIEVMGGIDLDPASSSEANKLVGADTFYTKENSGLDQPWEGRVWLNPPYTSDLVTRFADKLTREYKADRVDQACLLTNNATETQWFQKTVRVANAVCFPDGRITYWNPDRTSRTPLQGQVVLYFGSEVRRFRSTFGGLGAVLVT